MTETTMRAPTLLRVVLIAHGLITLAGAFVLVAFPTAIPSMISLSVTRQEYLLVYLVGAAELAVAVLSFGAARLTDTAALRLVVVTLIVLHGVSGMLDILYMALTETSATLIANTIARFAVVVVFFFAWRAATRHHTPGTRR